MIQTITKPLADVELLTAIMSDKEFMHFCSINKKHRIERDKYGNIIIMPPLSGKSGYREDEVIVEIKIWHRKISTGMAYGSNTGFILPNGATRSPDASWTSQERWNKLTDEEKDRFLPVVPDFVIEVRSKSDGLKQLKDKMEEWLENGVRLAWLIDPKNKTTYIYRANGTSDIVEGFDKKLSGEDVAVGFEFDLSLLLKKL